jgi:mRNA interferase RelE/StbE
MLNLEFSRQCDKFLQTLTAKHFKQIDEKLNKLIKSPISAGCILLKGKNPKKYYRAACGEYRIIYRFDEAVLFVHLIGKRNDSEVYKDFDRGSG